MTCRPLRFGMGVLPFLALAFAGNTIRLAQYTIDPKAGEPAIPDELRFQRGAEPLVFYKIIHLSRPMDKALGQQIRGTGAEILHYLPDNGFLVRLEREAQLDGVDAVDWVGDYHPAYKLNPAIGSGQFTDRDRLQQGLVLIVTLHPGSSMAQNRNLLQSLGGQIQAELAAYHLRRFEVGFSPREGLLTELAHLEDVAWISEKGERALRNGRSQWIIQSYNDPNNVTMARPIWDQGLQGQGEVVGVIDGRMDITHCFFEDSQVSEAGPTHRKVVYADLSGGVSGHGTHVAGSVAGIPENDDLSEAGMAYRAKLAFTSSIGNQSGDLLPTFETHASHGAFIHSNSWGEVPGSPVATDYTRDCVDIDTFTYNNEDHLVLFASMNGSVGSTPLLSPENSINVLAVGATEAGDVANPEELAEQHGSCRIGPTVIDGRRKPEIFAPGCGLVSARSNSGCGTRSDCGTSMATPVTAGAIALIRQYFREGFYPGGMAGSRGSMTPSGALLKAVALNGTVNMLDESLGSDLPIPNDIEGWGRLNLDESLYFAGDSQTMHVQDIRNGDGLSTGENQSFVVDVAAGEPFRVTLVFTGPPGMQGTDTPVVNDLDLRVTAPDDEVFLGNVWSNGASTSGGSPDPLNNVEQVLLTNPMPGNYTIEVLGTAVNMGTQGFAIAARGNIPLNCSADADAGDDAEASCWGEPVALNGSTQVANPTAIEWTPAEGLSDPTILNPLATPATTTTYTLRITAPLGCSAIDEVTVTVPPMNLDGDEDLDSGDIAVAAADWYTTNLGLDFNGDGITNSLDLVIIQNCVP